MKSEKGCGPMFPNDILLYYRCFSGVKTVRKFSIEGVDYCNYVKVSHK